MIGCYARVSTSEQAENGHSIDEQQDRMQKYADAMGWKVYNFYVDAGFTGANTNRPALQRLIRDIKTGKIDRVLVYKLDRLSRSQRDTLMLIEDVFLANNCDFVSMSENFDTSSPFGRAMIGILSVFAQLEREQIKERMKMGKEARAKLGKFGGSNYVPIGYDYVDGNLVTNEFEKMQVIRIFNEYVKGKSPRMIAQGLNDDGLTHKFGIWIERTVRNILEKRTYLGYTAFNGEWYKGTHEAFIDSDLFETVQSIIHKRKQDALIYNRRLGKANSYLGGFLYCAQCGGKYGKINSISLDKKFKYEYYKCKSRIKGHSNCKNKVWKMNILDSLIFDEIKKLSLEPLKAKEIPDNSPVILNKIKSIDDQLEKLMDLYSIGEMPLNILQEKIHSLNDQKTMLESNLEQQEDEKLSADDAKSLVDSFESVLEHGDFDEIRTVIGALIDKIVLDGEDVSIYWSFL